MYLALGTLFEKKEKMERWLTISTLNRPGLYAFLLSQTFMSTTRQSKLEKQLELIKFQLERRQCREFFNHNQIPQKKWVNTELVPNMNTSSTLTWKISTQSL